MISICSAQPVTGRSSSRSRSNVLDVWVVYGKYMMSTPSLGNSRLEAFPHRRAPIVVTDEEPVEARRSPRRPACPSTPAPRRRPRSAPRGRSRSAPRTARRDACPCARMTSSSVLTPTTSRSQCVAGASEQVEMPDVEHVECPGGMANDRTPGDLTVAVAVCHVDETTGRQMCAHRVPGTFLERREYVHVHRQPYFAPRLPSTTPTVLTTICRSWKRRQLST